MWKLISLTKKNKLKKMENKPSIKDCSYDAILSRTIDNFIIDTNFINCIIVICKQQKLDIFITNKGVLGYKKDMNTLHNVLLNSIKYN